MRLRGVCVVVVIALVTGCAWGGTRSDDDPISAGTSVAAPATVPATVPTTGPTTAPTSGVRSAPTSPALATGEVGPDVGDPYHPSLGNTGIDALHYDLDLVYDPVTSVMEARAGIDLRAETDLAAFDLDLVGLAVETVTVNGAAPSYVVTGDEIEIELADPVVAGTPLRVEVAYGGPMEGATVLSAGFEVGWFSRPWGSFVVGEPDGARMWFPADDHPTDKATYTVAVTVPADLEVVATGVLTGTDVVDGGRRRWTYEARDPTASYLLSVVVGDLELTAPVTTGGVVLRHALAPGTRGRGAVERTEEMIDFLSGWFGPYPFEAYGVVVVPEALGFGLENQTLSLLGPDLMADTAATERLLVHELAHQWAGNDVSVERWSDIWLNEGFATYAEWLWSEHTGAATTAELAAAKRAEALDGAYPSPLDPGPDDMFAPTVYGRGALVLDALRLEMGDSAFADLVRTWIARHGGSSASTDDFLELTAEIGGAAAEEVAVAWLTSESVPEGP